MLTGGQWSNIKCPSAWHSTLGRRFKAHGWSGRPLSGRQSVLLLCRRSRRTWTPKQTSLRCTLLERHWPNSPRSVSRSIILSATERWRRPALPSSRAPSHALRRTDSSSLSCTRVRGRASSLLRPTRPETLARTSATPTTTIITSTTATTSSLLQSLAT